ncbi:ABC transporter permease [bacterium]|nr:ABC transporter permease [bacterium]
MGRIGAIVKKETILLRRDRILMALMLIMPLVQLVILGYVLSSEIRGIPAVVCDLDRSRLSRSIPRRLSSSGYFKVIAVENEESSVAHYLDRGLASVAVVIPHGFSKDLISGVGTGIQLLLDGQDSNTATLAAGYLTGILESFIGEQISDPLKTLPEGAVPAFLSPDIRIRYNPDLRQKDFMVPGIVVMLLTMITTLISAMGLVREREIGTLEQLLVAPVKKQELLIGKIIPFAVVGFIELAISLLFAKLWYEIPIRGSIGLYMLMVTVYLFTTLGTGLLVSTVARTQQQAMFITIFLLIFMMIMSGFIFPLENMPKNMRWMASMNPMSFMVRVTRDLFIKGAGFNPLYKQGMMLAVFGLIVFSVAVIRFRKRMS